MMKFGNADVKNETFVSMNMKSLSLLLPAILLGHYIDKAIKTMKLSKINSVFLQSFINICVIYILHKISASYTKEFQLTLAGLFFSAMFFGLQTNYMQNIKDILG